MSLEQRSGALKKKLVEWRLEKSFMADIPPYAVFHDRILEEISKKW